MRIERQMIYCSRTRPAGWAVTIILSLGFLFFLFSLPARDFPSSMVLVALLAFFFVAAIALKATEDGFLDGVRASLRDRMRSFIGHEPRHVDFDFLWGSGKFRTSCIAADDTHVFVLSDCVAYKIPWQKIRRYEWQIQGWDKTTLIDGSVNAHIAVGAMNQRAREQAEAASGLTIQVADVDTPSVVFKCNNERLLRRWAEIFEQKFEALRCA